MCAFLRAGIQCVLSLRACIQCVLSLRACIQCENPKRACIQCEFPKGKKKARKTKKKRKKVSSVRFSLKQTKRSQTSQAQPGPARPTQTTKLQVSPNRMQKWSKTVHFGYFSGQLPRGPFAKRFGRSWLTPPKQKYILKKNVHSTKTVKKFVSLRILTKQMTLVRILDEFENCNRDRRKKEKKNKNK